MKAWERLPKPYRQKVAMVLDARAVCRRLDICKLPGGICRLMCSPMGLFFSYTCTLDKFTGRAHGAKKAGASERRSPYLSLCRVLRCSQPGKHSSRQWLSRPGPGMRGRYSRVRRRLSGSLPATTPGLVMVGSAVVLARSFGAEQLMLA